MSILENLSSLALNPLIEGMAGPAGELAVTKVASLLADHFLDQSQRLTNALNKANDHAWRTLEIALAGESMWTLLDRADSKALRQHVRQFLDSTPLDGVPDQGADYRKKCLQDLRQARKTGLLTAGKLEPRGLAQQVGSFARFSDQQHLLDSEWGVLERLADELKVQGHSTLAHFISLRPENGQSLLVLSVRFFFRRHVETDQQLFQGLSWAKLEALGKGQQGGFLALEQLFNQHSQRMEELFADVQEKMDKTHGAVLDIQAEQQRQSQQLHDLYSAIGELLKRHDFSTSGKIRPRDSFTICSEGDRKVVKSLEQQFRSLPPNQQKQSPALLNSLAQLQVGAGDFHAAQQNFQKAATLVSDAQARAAIHHNAYWAALERRNWETALDELKKAVQLNPSVCEPFPFNKYEPHKILGAGGFGVAFLCRHCNLDTYVVIKTLRAEGLARDVTEIFKEARTLESLDHTAIIRVRDCDFVGTDKSRAYLVMDYFDGMTLEDYITQRGELSVEEVLQLLQPVVEGLQAAHSKKILHRDIKPANLLVRKTDQGWDVKLIDFGLALKTDPSESIMLTRAPLTESVSGRAISGTLDYAPPEQTGKLPGVPLGPYSDVYSLARTCCQALFKTTTPLPRQWRKLPEAFADLLEECLIDHPKERLVDLGQFLQRLSALRLGEVPASHVTASTTSSASHIFLEPITPVPAVTMSDPQPSPLQVGSRVRAKWKNLNWYLGRIDQIRGEKVFVKYDDGDEEWTTMDLVEPTEDAASSTTSGELPKAIPVFRIGDRVMAKWKNSDWYPGQITQKQGDQVFIKYDDGDEEWTTIDLLREESNSDSGEGSCRVSSPWKIGDRVFAFWPKGDDLLFSGTITAVGKEKNYIVFDDGDEDWVSADLMKSFKICLNDHVWSRRDEQERSFYQAQVCAVQGDKVQVQFGDGEKIWVPLKWISVAV